MTFTSNQYFPTNAYDMLELERDKNEKVAMEEFAGRGQTRISKDEKVVGRSAHKQKPRRCFSPPHPVKRTEEIKTAHLLFTMCRRQNDVGGNQRPTTFDGMLVIHQCHI